MKNKLTNLFSLYSRWDEDEIQRWEKKYSRGITRFLLLDGVVIWGIPSGMIFMWLTISNGLDTMKFIATVLVWFIAGICYGLVVWQGTSQSYALSVKSKKRK
jgi:hypothetical protein